MILPSEAALKEKKSSIDRLRLLISVIREDATLNAEWKKAESAARSAFKENDTERLQKEKARLRELLQQARTKINKRTILTNKERCMTNQPHEKEKEDAFVFNWYRFFKVLALVVYAVLLMSMLAGRGNRDWDDALIIFFIFSPAFYGSIYALNKLLNHAACYIYAGDIYLKEKWRPILFMALWGVPCILLMLYVLSEYLTFFNAYPRARVQ